MNISNITVLNLLLCFSITIMINTKSIINYYNNFNSKYYTNINDYEYECFLYNIKEICPNLILFGYVSINNTNYINQFTYIQFKLIDNYNNLNNCLEDYEFYNNDYKFNCYIFDNIIYTQNKLYDKRNEFKIVNYIALFLIILIIFIIFIGYKYPMIHSF